MEEPREEPLLRLPEDEEPDLPELLLDEELLWELGRLSMTAPRSVSILSFSRL